jgi:hypothetical protein
MLALNFFCTLTIRLATRQKGWPPAQATADDWTDQPTHDWAGPVMLPPRGHTQ